MPNNEVSVILPALDEEPTIGKVIDTIPVKPINKRGYDVDIMQVG